MEYPKITDEQKQAIKDLFDCGYDLEITFATMQDGYYIDLENMYDYIEFKAGLSVLRGYGEIAGILHVSDGDELDRYYYRGCETCDFGSRYRVRLKFW